MNIELLNKANKEITELKAQFAAVKYLIDGSYCENSENNAGLEREWLDHLYRMIDTDNDNQCLIDIKVSAIRDAISNSEQVELQGQGYVGTYVSLEDLEVNIKQLGDCDE